MRIKVPDIEFVNLSRHQVQIAVFDDNSSFISIIFFSIFIIFGLTCVLPICLILCYVPRRLPKFIV